MDQATTQQMQRVLRKSQRLCVFTGAGISVPSGIPDFRSADGLYNRESATQVPPEQIISHSFFVAHPEQFYAFYKANMLYLDAKPNAAHRFFAELEANGKQVSVVTQNIDGLHTAAGSQTVFEIHGSVLRNHCMQCGKAFSAKHIAESHGIPRCDACGGMIKPDVVLYEEPLDERVVRKAVQAVAEADTMVVIGTSLVVYPAASYVHHFCGENLMIVNKTATDFDRLAQLVVYEDIVEVVHALTAGTL